jgi:hypothetical protein
MVGGIARGFFFKKKQKQKRLTSSPPRGARIDDSNSGLVYFPKNFAKSFRFRITSNL